MRLWTGYAASMPLAMALAMTLAGVAAPAEANSMRERLKQAQMQRLERAIGPQAAARWRLEPKIVGGKIAPAGAFPFQAGILNAFISNNSNAQFCGGSVIAGRFILTAAHCVDEEIVGVTGPEDIDVLTNTQTLDAGGVRGGVEQFWKHPGWNNVTFNNDVAVVKTKNRITGIRPGRRAKIITTLDEEAASAQPGTQAKVIGWGQTESTPAFPDDLHEVRVPIITRALCNREDSYDGSITAKMLCAGFAAGGKDSCQGDSGGPLLVKNERNRYRLQVGVVSWGVGCADPNFYGVYSRLARLGPWVMNIVAANSD